MLHRSWLRALYAYPGGGLTDRWGQRASLMPFSALSLAGYLVVLTWKHWIAVLLGSFLNLAWSALWLPATFTVVAATDARGRVRGARPQEFGEPARTALIIGQAPTDLRRRTCGACSLIRDGVVTSGSFLGAWLWHVDPRANFLGAATPGLLGTLWFGWLIHPRIDRTA